MKIKWPSKAFIEGFMDGFASLITGWFSEPLPKTKTQEEILSESWERVGMHLSNAIRYYEDTLNEEDKKKVKKMMDDWESMKNKARSKSNERTNEE